jgi:hypothetical protein
MLSYEAVSKVNFIKSIPNNICPCALCAPISAASVVKFNHRDHKEVTEVHSVFMSQKHHFLLPFFYFTYETAS